MIVNTHPEVTFTFKASDYFLVKSCSDEEIKIYQWSLNPRISREYAGKSDDIGSPVLFLSDIEAEALFKAGFSKIEL